MCTRAMFRRVRFQCAACGEGFVDWHDDDWERSPVFCVNCGEAIVSFSPVDGDDATELTPPSTERSPARALGVLKADGDRFRDTIPGLRAAPPHPSSDDAPDSSQPPPTARSSSRATSSAPRSHLPSITVARRRRLSPWGALLLGFAAGIPIALLAERPVSRWLDPAGFERAELGLRLNEVSAAIDAGTLARARDLLDRLPSRVPENDARLTTLHARLALAYVLTNQPAAATRELSDARKGPAVHPAVGDIQRVYDALFEAKPSAPASSASAVASAVAKPKPVVTTREMLTFARDRQHRAQLDDAQRLYEAVLRLHPNDAEARCGLAEVQVLRGGVDDGAAQFARALRDNPSYSPAWVGLADIDWLSGNAARAACRYQVVIDRFPASSYPPYIVQRVAQVRGSGADVPPASSCAQ